MIYIESELKLNELQADKQPLRAHLTALWRQTGVQPQLLKEAPQLPENGAHIWFWYCELNKERTFGMDGPSKISHRDITEWANAYGITIHPWERRAIKKMDAVQLGLLKRSEEE